MHSLLVKQINLYLEEKELLLPKLLKFLKSVDESYNQSDSEREHAAQTLEQLLKELTERNDALNTRLEVHQRTEAQLENLLSLLGATLESTTDGILALDHHGKIIRFNHRFIELWRVSEEITMFWSDESIFQHLQEHVLDSKALMENFNRIQQQPDYELFVSINCINNRVIECYSLPLKTGAENVGRILSFRDITERKLAEEALQHEKNEQLALIKQLEEAQNQLLQSEKMASIGQLAAGVAHEVNNPIGFVYSNLGTLERYVQDLLAMLESYEQSESAITDVEVKSKLQASRQKLDISFLKEDLRSLMVESKDGITRVKSIVQNLKDFSHIDSSDEWQYADLHSGLNSTLNIVSNEIKYKAEVVKEYGDIQPVECLPSQLNQVFMNLLVNASHAIEDRGVITIRSGMHGNEIWVEVEDTGKGIPSENLKKIFDPFFTTKPIGKGTGLGLSLSYGIIQKHNGRIEVRSIVGKGTVFKILLPLKHVQI